MHTIFDAIVMFQKKLIIEEWTFIQTSHLLCQECIVSQKKVLTCLKRKKRLFLEHFAIYAIYAINVEVEVEVQSPRPRNSKSMDGTL